MSLPIQFKERRILSSAAASLGLVYLPGSGAIQKWTVSGYHVSLLDRLAPPPHRRHHLSDWLRDDFFACNVPT